MGRGATKAAGNVYYQARIEAAKWNGSLSSREGAAEALGVSVDTVKNIELGLHKCVPVDLVVLMADLYLGVDDIADDPADNIYAGTYIISGFVHKYDDYNLALMAYNCGETGASCLWKQGYYSSKYSRSIINYMEDLIEQGIAGEMTLDGTFG